MVKQKQTVTEDERLAVANARKRRSEVRNTAMSLIMGWDWDLEFASLVCDFLDGYCWNPSVDGRVDSLKHADERKAAKRILDEHGASIAFDISMSLADLCWKLDRGNE